MNVPNGIDLDQYRTQAKDLLKQAQGGAVETWERLRAHHPEHEKLFASSHIRLADAQLLIARENGFGSWARFKESLILRTAIRVLDSGDAAALKNLLARHPALVKYRTGLSDGGYFARATLLHHVAGNPIRCPIPENIVDLAAILLTQGADPNAMCGVPGNLYSTIGLLITSRQASEAGVALPLIDLLTAAGARDNILTDPDLLTQPIWNGGRATAEALVRRGAKMDARHAAALGRMDLLPDLLAGDTDNLLAEQALVYACVQNQEEIVRYLVRRGAKGDINVSPGNQSSALHNAAGSGLTRIVTLLLENGADARVLDTRFQGTPAGWADHGGHPELAELLRQQEMKFTG